MGSLGFTEMLVILVIALVFFGPRKLPELGRSLGKSLNEFKKASNELRSTLEDEVRIEEQREQRAKLDAEQQSAVDAAQPTTAAPEEAVPHAAAPPEDTHPVSRTTSA
jgi:TatA/E family protein of Tat protein translocase